MKITNTKSGKNKNIDWKDFWANLFNDHSEYVNTTPKNKWRWHITEIRVHHPGGGTPKKGYICCEYDSCVLTKSQIDWARENLKDLESLQGLSYDGYSIDGELLNNYIKSFGKQK